MGDEKVDGVFDTAHAAVSAAFEGQCETIAVRDGVPRPAERCELPADHEGPHVFAALETEGTAKRCPAEGPDGARCELTAGHDRGSKASPHMVDRGDGQAPLTWGDDGVAAIYDEEPGETVAEAAERMVGAANAAAAAIARPIAERTSGRDTSRSPAAVAFDYLEPYLDRSGDISTDGLRDHVQEAVALALQRADRRATVDGTNINIDVEHLHGLVYQAAGAATAPLMRDHPGYVFPSSEVGAAVGAVLAEFGIPEIVGYPRDGGALEIDPPPVNPPEAPRALLEPGHPAVVVPFISARMNHTGRRLQAQLHERPEIIVEADSVPELHDALWDALTANLAARTDATPDTRGWHVRFTYEVWSGRSQIEQGLEGQIIVLSDGSIDQAVAAIVPHLDSQVGARAQRAENVQATWVRRLGEVIVG